MPRELILDGGEQLDGYSRLLKCNITPDGSGLTICTPKHGIVAVLDQNQIVELECYLRIHFTNPQVKA